ncbi:hypothetical protein F5B20DRAFT_549890 [Whalleya microplaca]|nr:hypothetical protein F5B20DRAFT_549890 [Whalleya microplaca]
MRRAINSCLLAFPTAASKHKIVLLPEMTDVGTRPSSIGSDVRVLLEEFGEKVDANGVRGDWNSLAPTSRSAFDLEKIEARTKAGREWLADLAFFTHPDAHIVVMTHGQTAHWLTDDFEGVQAPGGLTTWGLLEYRSYQFNFFDKSLVETAESRARRGVPAAYTLDEAAKQVRKEAMRQRILERMP